ncbi:MAG: hypothetical protein HOC74_04765, partial [Gemmatimonadetes bacterium]|nr:hypothetical protein [Gemmatimonadota bacterium]
MKRLISGLIAGLLICMGSGSLGAQVVDPRRGDDWTHLRTVNLGPKAGNGVLGNNVVLEEKGNRAFIGNVGNISVVDLQLNVVTGTIGEFRISESDMFYSGLSSMALGISEKRGELYARWSSGGRKVSAIDLATLESVGEIELDWKTTEFDNPYVSIPEYPRPMVVDEERDRLYVGNPITISVIDLEDRSVLEDISFDGEKKEICRTQIPSLIMDLAPDWEDQQLYVADAVNNAVVIVGLDDLQKKKTIQLELSPTQLALGPEGKYLYVLAREELEDPCYFFNSPGQYADNNFRVLKIDLSEGAVVGEVATENMAVLGKLAGDRTTNQNAAPLMVLDAKRGKLWVTTAPGWHPLNGAEDISRAVLAGMYHGGYLYPSKLFVIDAESLQIEREEAYDSIVQGLELNSKDDELLVLDVFQRMVRVGLEEGKETAAVEIGANPQDFAVSVEHNQVYVARGGHGGFAVLNGEGEIINTVPGASTLGVHVEDAADRLYVLETSAMDLNAPLRSDDPEALDNRVKPPRDMNLGVYELSSLRRLYTTPYPAGEALIGNMRADYEGASLWLPGINVQGLIKMDLLTGAFQENIGFYNTPMAIDVATRKAYIPDNSQLVIFDLVRGREEKRIDYSAFTGGATINGVAVDSQGSRLYIWAWIMEQGEPKQRIIIFDTEREEEVDFFDLGETQFHPGRAQIAFDMKNMKAYTAEGRVVDLIAQDGSRSFSGKPELLKQMLSYNIIPFDIGVNPVTNTVYTLHKEEDFKVYLGPSGTETPSPPAPAGVAAGAGDEEVTLSWNAVDDTTLVGYHVYRQDRPEADFVRITHNPLVETTYADEDLTNEQTYTYRATSLGRFALESVVPSDTASATPKGGRNFRVRLLRQTASVVRGDSVSLPMSIESLEGFDAEVELMAEAPEGISVTFLPAKVTPTWIAAAQVKAAADAPTGRFEIVLKGEGGGKENSVTLTVEVTAQALDESVLTLELDQEEVPLDIPLTVNGRLFPRKVTSIELDFVAEKADTTITQTVETDRYGEYRASFQAPFTDKWTVTASWGGDDSFGTSQSRVVAFAVTSGKTRITATSDLDDDGDLGWVATVKGRIYPSPGTVGVTLSVRKPDGTEETIEGILSSSEGFYGHDLRMDQQGLWELWTSWKGNDRLLGAASPVVTVPVGADVGRVLLMACGQDSPRDLFWSTSNYLGNLAYTTFQKRRLLKEKVFYLNDRQEQDVDRDGFQEDVDGGATMAGMSDAMAWVKERVNADNPLYVYLVGKGTPMGLEVSEGEVLTATQLGEWLDDVESSTGASVTLIVDAAHAGNFIRDLSSQGRKVVASTGLGLAFYQAEGYLSFSQYFLTDLYQGKSLQEAFVHTDKILRNLPGGFRDQRPGLEAEGNVIANQPGDYLQTLDAFIGAP